MNEHLKHGERRNATVLFSDMQGFSSLSERLDPEEIDLLMTRVFTSFERIIRRLGGSVEKYIGDALVAVFGVPDVHEDDPARAVHAALELRKELERIEPGIVFRTGIHTGLVTTGKRGEFDVVTGHAMAVASRLESAARPGVILISQATADECGAEFVLAEQIELDVRGVTARVTAYPVLGKRVGLHEYRTPFVGRERFVAAMLRSYMAHDPSLPGGYCVVGPAGIGKTRLVMELVDRLKRVPGFDAPVLYSRARRFRSLPFGVIHDLIIGYAGANPSENRPRFVAALLERLSYRGGERVVAGTDRDQALVELVERYASLATEEHEVAEGEGFVTIHRLFETILGGTTGSAFSPIVFIDNTHLTDRPSVDFLRYYVDRASRFPFFVFAGRSGTGGVAPLLSELEQLVLDPLDPIESTALIDSIWPKRPEELARTIVANSGGVPLFVEEYVRYARAKKADPGEDAGLPPTIQTIFLASIDSWKPELQELLKKLSVFERSFTAEDAGVIHSRTSGDDSIVPEALEFYLLQGHLVCESGVYHFRHELFKRTLYESILNYNKRILHGVVADWIAEHGADIVRRHNLRYLFHLCRAERFDDLERAFFADVRHIHQADFLPYIDVLLERVDEEDPRYFRFLFIKYAILFNTRRSEATGNLLDRLLETSIARKQPEFAARVYQILSAEHLVSHNFVTAADYGRRALSWLTIVDRNHKSLQNIRENLASALLFDGRIDENLEIIEGMREGPGYDSRTSALVKRMLHLGEYRPAVELLESRLLASEPDETEFWYGGYYLFCLLLRQMHDYTRLESFGRLLRKAENQSASYYAETSSMLAMACRVLYGADAGSDEIRQADYYRYQIVHEASLVEPLYGIAVARFVMGNYPEAAVAAERALAIATRIGARRLHFALSVLLAEIAFRRNEEHEFRFFLGEADGSFAGFPALNRQDLAIYYYLKSTVTDGPFGGGYSGLAKAALEAECRAIGRDDLCRNLLAVRSFGPIDPDRLAVSASV